MEEIIRLLFATAEGTVIAAQEIASEFDLLANEVEKRGLTKEGVKQLAAMLRMQANNFRQTGKQQADTVALIRHELALLASEPTGPMQD